MVKSGKWSHIQKKKTSEFLVFFFFIILFLFFYFYRKRKRKRKETIDFILYLNFISTHKKLKKKKTFRFRFQSDYVSNRELFHRTIKIFFIVIDNVCVLCDNTYIEFAYKWHAAMCERMR